MFWLFVSSFLVLTWVGGQPVEDPYVWCGCVATYVYFGFFRILPVVIWVEDELARGVLFR